MGYSKQVLKGLGWVRSLRVISKAIVFFKVLIAYRYLSPSDIGLFGICAVVLGLLEMLTETGINVLLVKDKRPLSYFIDTAFFVSVVRGFLISLLVIILAYILPSFFREPALYGLLLWIALIPIIRGFINPAITKFQKELNFHQDAFLRLSTIIFEVLFALILVPITRSTQGLIWSMLLAVCMEVLVSYLFVWPRPRLRFNSEVFWSIIHPGKWLNLISIFNYVEQNFDNLVVGRMLGTTALGYYQTAFNLSRSLIGEIGLAFAHVLLPIYGKIEGDSNRLQKALQQIAIPAGILMLIPLVCLNLPPFQELMLVILKEKWRPMLELLPFLTTAAWLTGMNSLLTPVLVVKNNLRTMAVLYGSSVVFVLGLMFVLIQQQGLLGAAQAVLLARLLIQPFFVWRTAYALRSS